MSERWRKIPRWPYEASSAGRVRSLPRKLRNGAECGPVVLAPVTDKDGYQRVTLTDGKRRKTSGVHVLVLLAFEGPPEVRHLNGRPGDNALSNLAYGSHRDNERDKRAGRVNGEDGETEEGMVTIVSPPSGAISPVAGEVRR